MELGALPQRSLNLIRRSGYKFPSPLWPQDFEKNGTPDVVVVDPGVGAVVYVNDGTGLLKEAQPIDITNSLAGVGPLALTSGDVNEDGCPDVVTFDNLGIARVFLGNCDSTFQASSRRWAKATLPGLRRLPT